MPSDRTKCPVCNNQISGEVDETYREIFTVLCPRCGQFKIGDSDATYLKDQRLIGDTDQPKLGPYGTLARANASAWVRERSGPEFRLTHDHAVKMPQIKRPAVLERVERLMLALGRTCESVGEQVHIPGDILEWQAHSWSRKDRELLGMVVLLKELGYITEVDGAIESGFALIRLTVGGWEFLDQLSKTGADSTRGFVAMPFDSTLDDAFDDGFYRAIEEAGYRPYRLDRDEYTGKIDDKLVAEIRRCKFLVADLTLQNQNVYWEAGFAEGLGRELFLTCRADDFENRKFDKNHDVCIKWENPDDLREKLLNKIVSVLGPGPHTGGVRRE